jgi:hypothetical protein
LKDVSVEILPLYLSPEIVDNKLTKPEIITVDIKSKFMRKPATEI